MTPQIERHIRIIARALARNRIEWVLGGQRWDQGDCHDVDIDDYDRIGPYEPNAPRVETLDVAGDSLINRLHQVTNELNRLTQQPATHDSAYNGTVTLTVYATGRWYYRGTYQQLTDTLEGDEEGGTVDLTQGTDE